jgi:hypothetical protein
MIANDIRQINPARRSGLALRAARWALSFFESEIFFSQRPYAALRAPRSRRDKDMSDNKAIKQTITVFPVVEFCISPKKVTVIVLPWVRGHFWSIHCNSILERK